MKKLLSRLFILLVLLFIADRVIGVFLKQVLERSPDGRYYKANATLNQTTADLIIFGSSRAEENYAPFVFEDSLKVSCWNAGRGGQSLPYWDAVRRGILNRYTPKIVLINIDSYFLSLTLDQAYERSGMLRPFYYTNPEIRPVLNKISPFEALLLKSRLYAYNSSYYYLFRPYLLKGLDGKREDNGWKPRQGYIDNQQTDLVHVDSGEPLNQQSVKLFEGFVESFTSRGSKVFVVVSPDYNKYLHSTPTIEYVQNMENVVFIDYGKNTGFATNNGYFCDPSHLNREGAIEFSRDLCGEIKKHLIPSGDYYASGN